MCGTNQFGQMGIAYGDIDEDKNHEQFNEFAIIPRLSMVFKVEIKMVACGSFHMLAINSYQKVLA